MKKTRMILTSALAIILSLSIAFSVYAQGVDESYHTFFEEEHGCSNEIIQSENGDGWGTVVENFALNNGNAARGTCINCYNFSAPLCFGESVLIEEGYHSLGMVGLIMTDCYAYCYGSRGAEVCTACYSVLWTYDELHYCREVHMKCWKGDYDICPMDKNW